MTNFGQISMSKGNYDLQADYYSSRAFTLWILQWQLLFEPVLDKQPPPYLAWTGNMNTTTLWNSLLLQHTLYIVLLELSPIWGQFYVKHNTYAQIE